MEKPPDTAGKTTRRINIYLPLALATRLEAVRDHVNVSSVCQEALEQAVNRATMIGGDERAARVVDRLLATEATRRTVFQRGVASGRRWAEEVASWPDIKGYATNRTTLGLTYPADLPEAITDAKVLYTNGFKAGLRDVYELVKDAMEPPADGESDDS